MREIVIDGSYGEGGGQILRTSLFLSTVLKMPIKVENIRAKRDNPGLRPQHLATVKAFIELTGGKAENLKVGSTVIRYVPGSEVRYVKEISIGTAGSITLMLQSLLPALSLMGRELSFRVIGGTDTRWSPTFDYFRYLVIPLFRKIGLDVDVYIMRRGYYPKGGGIVQVKVGKSKTLKPLMALEKDEESPVKIKSIASRLPLSVAQRQANSAKLTLGRKGLNVEDMEIRVEDAISPGTSILVYSASKKKNFLIGGDSIGEKGLPAEEVGRRAAENFLTEYYSEAVLDRHLADMVVPIISLIPEESIIVTSDLTGHLNTNLYIAHLFTKCKYEVIKRDRGVIVKVRGRG